MSGARRGAEASSTAKSNMKPPQRRTRLEHVREGGRSRGVEQCSAGHAADPLLINATQPQYTLYQKRVFLRLISQSSTGLARHCIAHE
eukprot:2183363-Rhodomonas_salina.1